uniref:Cell division protein n=1 Tax=Pedinomonas minor TaxID=3159 RepID=C7BEP5_PEDMN|nr:cell division protein [Pedinomonas minor]ACQ90838.1 cell division protein [Pedinomonas minor]
MKLENTNRSSLFYFLNIFQLTVLKYYLNILDSKETAKDQINKSLTLFNYFCFWLSISPFLWFICKLPVSTNRSTLSTNLPGLHSFSNEMFWETILNSFDYNEKLFESVNDLEINPNSFLLNHTKLNSSIQTLINVSSNFSRTEFKEFKPRELEQTKATFDQRDLDEIPTKLESNIRIFKKTNLNLNVVKTNVNDLENVSGKSEQDKTAKFLTLDLKKPTTQEQKVKAVISKEKTKLKLLKTHLSLIDSNNFSKQTTAQFSSKQSETWSNFSLASELVNKYSRNLFFQSLQPLQEFNGHGKSSISVSKTSETDYLRPRFMTGYNYPDLTENQIWKLKLSEFLKSEPNQLTVSYYPKSIYFSSLPFSKILQPGALVPPIYEIGQSQTENGRESFISYDSKTLDLLVKNRFSTQSSLFQDAVSNNLETVKPVYFFANLDKTSLTNLVSNNNLFTLDHHFTNLNHSIFRTPTFFSSLDPLLTQEDLETRYHQLPVNNLFHEGLLAIPVSDLRQGTVAFVPNTTGNQSFKILFLKDANSAEFFKNLFQSPTKETNQTNLRILNQFLNINSNIEYSSNLYKREIGSYWKTKVNQTDEFLTLNEILTSSSVLSVSLFGFLISSFLILKTAYEDYAKEFSSYLLDLISSGKGLILDPSTIEWLNQELGLEEKKGGIRVFPKQFSKKRFTDIAGIKQLLPELSELVWFLRNKGRKFKITPLTSKSLLLVGPPGTGKTLLVQALAGEAEVPVVAQSTSVLASMQQDLTPGDAIRLAFQKARSLAPCILFLDELDSLGLKRDSLLTNNSQQVIGLANEEIKAIPFFERTTSQDIEISENSDSDYLTNQLRINITNEFNSRKQQEREQVAALTQLLIEIDGLQTNAGILVIGATNRAHILDPALTRPGRFSKIINLPLPDKLKRIEIFKLRATQLGWESQINWEYLAQRTKGFSAGDLSTIVNQSAIQAILENSKHTLESFENAITVLTTYPIERGKIVGTSQDPYSTKREVYYKVAQSLYNYHENVEGKAAFVELTPRQPNPRHYQILANVNNDKNHLRTRLELEKVVTSLVAGKAGELLMLLTSEQKTNFYWESDLAKNDFYEATKLVLIMFQEWYLYSSFLQQQKFLLIPNNQNQLEYRKNEELFSLFEETVRYLEQQLTNQFSFSESFAQRAQWKTNVIHEMTNIDSLFAEWSRFHLPDPQETERNPEWIPPEEYYHDNQNKRLIDAASETPELVGFSELVLIERDRYLQTILFSSFNKAFTILETNRELLDILACFLFKHKILRSFELTELISKYNKRS